ncbi:small membrane protein [Escherichia coli]|uniref:small membrane protein n=1 Tax=Escherichia coli TaxID=562 RepID=UPI00287619BE|nr:small membrane protein [Escherichia coli]MDS0776192.1 small membrane protein [Escherichia coli]MDT3795916.1 small membrane protein [Escherichia coli]
MDWILLAIAIALLVVAVYSGISYFREKKQSVVHLGDSALFTITSFTRTAKTASGRFWWLTGKRWWQVHRKPPETRLIYFTHMHGYSHHRIAGDFGREKGPGR